MTSQHLTHLRYLMDGWKKMLSYPDIFNFLMFYPIKLGSKDLSDYKNSKAYYTKPRYSNLEYLRLRDRKTVFKKSHKYYKQCMLQMAVTRTIKNYFVAWTPNGMTIDEIYFDNEFWYSMKNQFQKYYEHFLKVYFQWVES